MKRLKNLYLSRNKIQKWVYKHTVSKPYSYIRKHSLSIIPFLPSKTKTVPQAEQIPDYIVWGVIDWHFRYQRPQHISTELSKKGRRVFYISSNFINDKRSGFSIEPLDQEGRLFQVKLYLQSPPIIYFKAPNNNAIIQLRQSIGELLNWANSRQIVSFVQHSFWFDIARVIPNSRLIYDCIDHHEGFGNNSHEILALEHKLFEQADLVVCTSGWIDQHVSKYTNHRIIIRNGADFEHFASKPKDIYKDPLDRQIIGYFGAIADWFDIDLIRDVSKAFHDCSIVLIGADTANVRKELMECNNIIFIGEVSYSNLPYYLHAFDVALLPFKTLPLTLATNPVKVYEYLSAGKPVVSVDLPEISIFEDLVYKAKSAKDFINGIEMYLHKPFQIDDAQQFAIRQTWQHRVESLISSAENYPNEPLISIIIVTFNNIELTKKCLESIENYSDYSNLELIVIDNASSDGTQKYLKIWSNSEMNRLIILNDINRGFAAANNQGLKLASGKYFVLLNNDTYVTPGWVRTMFRHFCQNQNIGLLGPVTNNIGNEAKININYNTMKEMIEKARAYTSKHIGKLLQLSTVAFFCVMIPRKVYEEVGELDEQFGLGFFEDDDYCRRVEQARYEIRCAEDVFVHHHLSASFMKINSDDRRALFEKNKMIYEIKWGTWIKHEKRKV